MSGVVGGPGGLPTLCCDAATCTFGIRHLLTHLNTLAVEGVVVVLILVVAAATVFAVHVSLLVVRTKITWRHHLEPRRDMWHPQSLRIPTSAIPKTTRWRPTAGNPAQLIRCVGFGDPVTVCVEDRARMRNPP